MTIHDNTERTFRKNARRRIRTAEASALILCLGFTVVFGTKYVVLPQIDPEYHSTKNSIIYDEIKNYAIEGDILDRNGNIILGNAAPGVPATASYPENYSYAYLLGYYTVNNAVEHKYGLRGNLFNYSLFTLNEENKGATVTLTTDNALQDYAYQLLNNQEGSITVLDNKTGKILALASHSTIDYDVNDTESFVTSDVEGAQFRRGTYENDPPGSSFKVVTTAAALTKAENEGLGEEFLTYNDNGTYTAPGDNWEITNWLNKSYGQIGLNEAMVNSVNCYFANLGVQTGIDQMCDTMDKFMIGKNIEIPYLCTLRSSYRIDENNLGTLAQAAYGQGFTEITPVHMAMIAQAIANNGTMMNPYIVDSIRTDSLTLYNSKSKKLSTTMDSAVNNRLKEAMHETALGYGFDESTFGMVYAKTSTAECAGDRIHSYMIGFTDTVSFCVSFNNMSSSQQLYQEATALVYYLNQNGF